MRQSRQLMATVLAWVLLPTSAWATDSLHVTLNPEHLGHSASVQFEIEVTAPQGHVPSPLTALDVRYPSTFGLATSELGLATCTSTILELLGPGSCPPNSRMGQGSAVAEIPVGKEIIQATAEVSILRAAEREHHIAMLFYAQVNTPVDAEATFPGILIPGPTLKSEDIHVHIPIIEGLPEAPDVAIVKLRANFGPHSLTYYEHAHGKLIAYKPQGILLPSKCPRHGFYFTAAFAFQNGVHSEAHTTVACPGKRSRSA